MSTPNHRPAQGAPSQAATLGGAGRWVLRLDETHLVKRTLLARAEKLSGGSYPAGFVLAEAPAHASKDELLQLAADRDGWRREVLRIDPSLVSHSGRLGKKQIAASIDMAGREWLEEATKMDGQFSGGHVRAAPETTKTEVENNKKETTIPLISP